MKPSSRSVIILSLFAILAIASFFRLYKLGSVPTGLYPDIAMNGINALQSLQTCNYRAFYPDNNGREGMIMWLDTASMNIFGISDIALKIPTAIFGILTVLGIYLLASELFDSTAAGAAFGKPGKGTCIGLLAAFSVATSFWHVNFSRLGFRVALMPFFLVFTFYFLARAFRYGKYLWAILAGIFFGLGF